MTASESTERCVGCGATVPRIIGPIHRYMTSSPGCWAMYGELNAHFLSDPDGGRYRQPCVDTFGVQHPGTPGPQTTSSVCVHLISLYGQIELGVSPDQGRTLIERALKRKGSYEWLTPPSFDGTLTVGHMLAHLADPMPAARAWAASAWQAWKAHHAQVKAWYGQLPS